MKLTLISTPVYAFVERDERSDGAAPFHKDIGVVNDTLWIGSPYGSHIEIDDFQGRNIKSLARNCRRTVNHAFRSTVILTALNTLNATT